jgi:hypothetical protein
MIKKIAVSVLLAILMNFGFSSANAQNQKSQTTITKEKSNAKADKPLKKDGTPDMRYKENKAGAKPAKHLKKDGTPDKRFSENK